MMKLQPIQDIRGLSLWGKSFGLVASMMIGYIAYGWGSAWWEILSAISGVVCVVLVAEGKLSNYLWGLVNCALYGLTSYHNSFFGDMSLNWAVYVPFQFIGFFLWNRATSEQTVEARALSLKQAAVALVLLAAAVELGRVILTGYNGQHPMTDSLNVCLSLLATLLMALRFKEQWLCWIAVNVSGIYLWSQAEGGDQAALLMWVAFLINSLYGYYRWSKSAK